VASLKADGSACTQGPWLQWDSTLVVVVGPPRSISCEIFADSMVIGRCMAFTGLKRCTTSIFFLTACLRNHLHSPFSISTSPHCALHSYAFSFSRGIQFPLPKIQPLATAQCILSAHHPPPSIHPGPQSIATPFPARVTQLPSPASPATVPAPRTRHWLRAGHYPLLPLFPLMCASAVCLCRLKCKKCMQIIGPARTNFDPCRFVGGTGYH